MKIEITKKTKYSDVFLYMSDEFIKELQGEIATIYPFDFYSLTIGCFADMEAGKPPYILTKKLKEKDITVYNVISIKNAIEKFMHDFGKIIKSFEIKQTMEEKKASQGLPEFSFIENMLLFTQKYFNLKDFGAAEKITLLEFLLAKKNHFTQQLFEKKLNDEFARKSKIRH